MYNLKMTIVTFLLFYSYCCHGSYSFNRYSLRTQVLVQKDASIHLEKLNGLTGRTQYSKLSTVHCDMSLIRIQMKL